ncbi:MAG: penicillin acylase family protein, partial [Steroidobacteraceae bacterium]
DFEREQLRREIDARLGGPACAGGWKCALSFLYPASTAWDAPNVADAAALRAEDARDAVAPPLPGPGALDVRSGGASGRDVPVASAWRPSPWPASPWPADLPDIGSNGWAVAGRLMSTGAALVASDMHLPLGVPPTWYRMRLRIRSGDASMPGAREPSGPLDLNGLTLPGAPALVAGSNGHVAWAFTNADGKWLDMRPVACLSVGDGEMRTPQGTVQLTTAVERIHVRGAADALLPVRSSPHGLLLESDPAAHRCWIGSWIAESPAATNMNLLGLERATSVQQVLALAPGIGIPEQNLVVGDSAGHIGWAIAGRVPTPGAAPHLYDPPIGRVWTANARATDDPAALAAIGGDDAAVGAQYDLGARARQIRDALLRLGARATPLDMLRIQLDIRAVFLARWRNLMLRLLDGDATARHPQRAEARRLVAAWDARADVGSVGYRLVRAWHDRTEDAVWGMILRSLGIEAGGPPPQVPPPQQFERPLWMLVSQQPRYLLDGRY